MGRVLLVDDDANIRDALGVVLHDAGHTVTLAGDGPEGLRLANFATPEVIVSDVMMPAMDGPEMIRRIRAIPRLKRVPVILMSAVETVPRVPVAAMLRKPLDPSVLLQLINELTCDSANAHEATGNARAEIAEEPEGSRGVRVVPSIRLLAVISRGIESCDTRIRRGLSLVREQEERLQKLRSIGADTAVAEVLHERLKDSVAALVVCERVHVLHYDVVSRIQRRQQSMQT